jgi:hypothetical protein
MTSAIAAGGVLSLSLILGGTTGAQASTVTYSLNAPNAALSAYPGPYGSVNVDLLSPTLAQITFTSASGYLFGDGGSADLQVNATTYTFGTTASLGTDGLVTATGPNNPPAFTGNVPGNVDAQGHFNLSLNFHDGFSQASNFIQFDIVDTSGFWASALNVLTANNLGNLAAAHVFPCADPSCSQLAGALLTGFAGTNGSSTPLPAALPLFAAGLGLIGVAGLRKKRKVARLAA